MTNKQQKIIDQLGGEAFPSASNAYQGGYPPNGMLLVDFFAAHALAGILTDKENHDMSSDDMADWAYDIALKMVRTGLQYRGEE